MPALRSLILLGALLGGWLPLSGQGPPLEGFEAYVAGAVAEWEAPGVAVIVVKDGEILFQRGFGVLELGLDAPVTPTTLFAIGSTTKAMTAAAVGMLVDEGKLDWDDPVTRHLPGFELSDPYLTRELRVRDLLTHNAGMGNADFLWYGQETTTSEVLDRFRYAEPAYSMRASFIYQNIMYAAAGELVARVSGMPWTEFIERRILTPLGMDGTVTTLSATEGRPNVARPHNRVDGRVVVIENATVDAIASAGSVWSSVSDMGRWLTFLLAGGETDGGERLLSEAVISELFRPQALVPASQFYPTARLTHPHWMSYGLGWFQHDYRGRAVDFHTGSIDGMVAIAGLIRDENLGVYVLANLDHAELRHALMYRVFDLFGEGPDRDWNADLKSLYDGLAATADSARAEEDARRVSGTTPSLPVAAYAGTYEDRMYGRVEVSMGPDGKLRLYYGPGLRGPLEHWHFDTFRVAWDARWRGTAQVTFRLGPDGRLAQLELGAGEFTRVTEPEGRDR